MLKVFYFALLMGSIPLASSLSWHDIRSPGSVSAAVVLTALCTYYMSLPQNQQNLSTEKPVVENTPPSVVDGSYPQWPRQPAPLSDESLMRIAQMIDDTSVQKHFNKTLDTICVERQPGTESHTKVRKFIQSEMQQLGWTVDEDSFSDQTPHGRKPFTNLIATLDPQACHRLVLACHYDSKVMNKFVGAIDSAVPCSQMINLVKLFDTELKAHKVRNTGLTLQLLFFDGEEAFVQWSSSDSLYGSRHLADTMHKSRFLYADEHRCRSGAGAKNLLTELDRIEVFILLDLLGSKNPSFVNFFMDTKELFGQMSQIEQRLNGLGMMEGKTKYFTGRTTFGSIEDDHIPFMRKDVPILHLIPHPFPRVWHEVTDTKENLHRPTIRNLNKIFAAFVAWYMEL